MTRTSQTHTVKHRFTRIFMALLALLSFAATTSYAAEARCDFNGDGYDDLAVGSSRAYSREGAVYVFFGAEGGLFEGDTLEIRPGSKWIPGEAWGLGLSVACGDFDQDSFADLVVMSNGSSGAVHALSGSQFGLTEATRLPRRGDYWPICDLWGENVLGCDPSSGALAVGDFDGDGYDDLAVGVHEDARSGRHRVYVYWGGISDGLDSSIFTSTDIGYAWDGTMTVGDFDGDGRDDLVLETIWGYGRYDRIRYYPPLMLPGGEGWPVGHDFRTLTSLPTEEVVQLSGFASGDFNSDGYDDLAHPSDDGSVRILHGGPQGLSDTVTATISYSDLPYADETVWRSPSLEAADFNGDGLDDLALGLPAGADPRGGHEAGIGRVFLLFTKGDGYPIAAGAEMLEWPLWPVGAEFGAALTSGNYNGDARMDLAIGVPGYNDESGAVQIYRGLEGATLESDTTVVADWAGGEEAKGNRFGDILSQHR